MFCYTQLFIMVNRSHPLRHWPHRFHTMHWCYQDFCSKDQDLSLNNEKSAHMIHTLLLTRVFMSNINCILNKHNLKESHGHLSRVRLQGKFTVIEYNLDWCIAGLHASWKHCPETCEPRWRLTADSEKKLRVMHSNQIYDDFRAFPAFHLISFKNKWDTFMINQDMLFHLKADYDGAWSCSCTYCESVFFASTSFCNLKRGYRG